MSITAKIKPRNECMHGQHVFIPVAWRKTKDKETCTRLMCQHCLLSVDKTEQEVMCSHHEEEIKKATKPPKKEE